MTPERKLDRFVAFAFATADVLVETDARGVVSYAAGAVGRLAPERDADIVGLPLFDLLEPADGTLVRHLLDEVRNGGRRGPVTVVTRNGQTCAISVLRTSDNEAHHVVMAGFASNRSAPLARDPATGLLPPASFADAAEGELMRKITGDQRLELSIIRLSALDQRPGGVDGPEVQALLARVAAALRAVALGGRTATHLGGGRFAVVHGADGAADRLAAGLDRSLALAGAAEVRADRQTFALEDPNLSPTEACAALRHVLERIERVETGELQLATLAEALTARLSDTAARVQAAKAAIDSRNFFLVYQPIVGLADGVLHHNEALARLRTNEPVFEYVTFAESIGFIADFDLAVARETLDKLVRMAGSGRHPHVAVNVSARSLQSDLFTDQLFKLLTAGGGTAKQILIEVTESFQITDLERANTIVHRFRENGWQVCLDDFGAGAAAFHYIRSLNVDYVKLDGAFVQRVLESDRDAAVLRSMVELCRSLDVKTIGEMVETEAQAARLREFGVTMGQGFHFGRPVGEPAGSAPPRSAVVSRGLERAASAAAPARSA